VQGILKLLLVFLGGGGNTIISRLKLVSLGSRNAAVKEVLTFEFAFAESNVDRKWDRVIFTDESTFSSANDGPILVYRPQGEHYNSQYMSTCKRSGRMSVHCWGWISHEGAGVLHLIEGHLDGLQYQHILQNVKVPPCTDALLRRYYLLTARALHHS
jgi:hypothetical protein